jgi:hypothetical protein
MLETFGRGVYMVLGMVLLIIIAGIDDLHNTNTREYVQLSAESTYRLSQPEIWPTLRKMDADFGKK